MKKLLLITSLILLTPVLYSSAQVAANNADRTSFYLGPVAGFGYSWVANVPGAGTSSLFSDYGGINFLVMGRHWGWGDQLVLSSEGYTANYVNANVSDMPIYLRMPMRAYYFFGNRSNIVRPDLYLGPSVALRVAEHTSTNNYFGDVYNMQNATNFRLFDLGIDGGAGIIVQLTRNVMLNFDLGFYDGLTDALKTPSNTYSPNRNTELTMGVLFGLR